MQIFTFVAIPTSARVGVCMTLPCRITTIERVRTVSVAAANIAVPLALEVHGCLLRVKRLWQTLLQALSWQMTHVYSLWVNNMMGYSLISVNTAICFLSPNMRLYVHTDLEVRAWTMIWQSNALDDGEAGNNTVCRNITRHAQIHNCGWFLIQYKNTRSQRYAMSCWIIKPAQAAQLRNCTTEHEDSFKMAQHNTYGLWL